MLGKAKGDLVTDITGPESTLGPYMAEEYRDVLYNVAHVNYFDKNGTLISNSAPNMIVANFIKDQSDLGAGFDYPIGAFKVDGGASSSTNGWLWSRDGPPYTTLGMQAGEVATNGLNGGSLWTAGIDLNNNGKVGTYTMYDNGTWRIDYEANEGMPYRGDPSALPGEYTFEVQGVPQHPESGTGPVTIDSINIFSPNIVPEPTTGALLLGGLGVLALRLCRVRP